MEETRTSVRLSPDLHERIKQLAARNRRSMNGELVWLIERGLEAEATGKRQETRSR